MEKNFGKAKTIAIILIGILLCVAAFGGVYLKKNGVWKNILPDYKYGMELGGYRELHFVLDDSEEEKEVYVDENGKYMGDVKEDTEKSSDTSVSMVDEDGNPVETPEETTEENKEETVEENDTGYKKETRTIKANPDEEITINNFEKAKKIIQDRIEKLENGSLNEYNIRQDTVTGEIILEVPDNGNLSSIEALVLTPGKITVTDYQNGLILIDSSHVKKASLLGTTTDDGYQAYLQLEFDKEGKEALKEISNIYVSSKKEEVENVENTVNTENTVDAEETEDTEETANEEETISYISISLDNSTLISTYFGQEIENGILQIPYGQAHSEYSDYYEFASQASYVVSAINSGSLPLVYKLSSDNFINTSITNNTLLYVAIIFSSCVLLVSIVMLIIYRSKAIRFIGLGLIYIALLSLVCRLTNVVITINSLIAFLGVIIINYWFYFQLLNSQKNNGNIEYGKTMKKLYLTIVPVIIIAIIFTFMSNIVVSSIGMLLFWGLLLQALVSLLV